jgi:hypothetical protein
MAADKEQEGASYAPSVLDDGGGAIEGRVVRGDSTR